MSWTAKVLGSLAAFMVLLIPGAAIAGTYSGGTATVSNSTPLAGSQVTISGSGFAPNSEVKVYFGSGRQQLAAVNADGSGSVSATVTIPSSATGTQTLELSGQDGSGQALVLSATVTIPSSGLPATGSSSSPFVLAAAVAALSGAALVLLVRLRRSAGAA